MPVGQQPDHRRHSTTGTPNGPWLVDFFRLGYALSIRTRRGGPAVTLIARRWDRWRSGSNERTGSCINSGLANRGGHACAGGRDFASNFRRVLWRGGLPIWPVVSFPKVLICQPGFSEPGTAAALLPRSNPPPGKLSPFESLEQASNVAPVVIHHLPVKPAACQPAPRYA